MVREPIQASRSQRSYTLKPEENAELGLLVRAIENLCAAVGIPVTLAPFIPTLFQATISTALERAKPDRRMAYLEQWRQFLCSLPGTVENLPAGERSAIIVNGIEKFELKNMRGRRKSAAIPSGEIRFASKDDELWYVRVHADGTTECLHPFNGPRVLKSYVKTLSQTLPMWRSNHLLSRKQKEVLVREIVNVAPDVRPERIEKWLLNRHSRKEVALLIAALRAGMAATSGNLPHLHEALRLAR